MARSFQDLFRRAAPYVDKILTRPFILALTFGLGASFMLSAPICAA